jgi:IclR family transcriptional regulator, KDG regulon repressor
MTSADVADGSLERLVAILDAFAGVNRRDVGQTGPAPLGVADLSRALGLSKGTVSRYLRRLEDAGVLQRLPDRRYVLGSRVHEWGQAAALGGDVRSWARPEMEALVARFGETVSLFVRDGDAAVCIDQVDGRYPIRLSAAVGRHLSLHAGGSPRLLFAFAPDAERDAFLARAPFPALTPATITGAASLRRAAERVRQEGYAISRGEIDAGAVCVAAPIRDASGAVRASLSLAGPASRMEGAQEDIIIAAVCAAASRISRALGYRASQPTLARGENNPSPIDIAQGKVR